MPGVVVAIVGASLAIHEDRLDAAEERRFMAELQRDALRLLVDRSLDQQVSEISQQVRVVSPSGPQMLNLTVRNSNLQIATHARNPCMNVRVPDDLVAWHLKLYGQATRPWIDAAPGVVEELLGRWGLRVDGSATNGSVSLIVPVVREGGVRAVLKLPPQIEERFRGEPVALRAWNGNGAVRLLEHDAGTGSMLLEQLDATSSLNNIPDDMEAFRILSELLARLTAIAAPPGLPLLSDIGADLLDRVQSALRRSMPESQRALLVRCATALREVLPEPGDRLLHGDLGHGNVLGSGPEDPREAWLAIDPTPFAGDPCFDLLTPLHHRWDNAVATGDVRRAVQRRFDLMTEVVGLDRKRATAWTVGRVVQSMLWDIEHDATASFTEHEADKTIALTLLAQRA